MLIVTYESLPYNNNEKRCISKSNGTGSIVLVELKVEGICMIGSSSESKNFNNIADNDENFNIIKDNKTF